MRELEAVRLVLPVLAAAALCSATAHAGELIPTTTSTGVTASSVLEDYENELMLAIFPGGPIASLTVHVRAYPDYGPDDAYCEFFGPGSEYTYFHGEKTFEFTSLPGSTLDRSQQIAICSYYTHEPHGSLGADDFGIMKLQAFDGGGQPVPVAVCAQFFDDDSLPRPGPDECRMACGDVECDGGEPKASDSLHILRGAVQAAICPVDLCDTNHDGNVTAGDALAALRRSVGNTVPLLCMPQDCFWIQGTL